MQRRKNRPNEYRLVTDGKQMYRLAPNFDIPEGIIEVFEYEDKKVYSSQGRLMPMFKNLQRIQPRLNTTKIALAVRNALGIQEIRNK